MWTLCRLKLWHRRHTTTNTFIHYNCLLAECECCSKRDFLSLLKMLRPVHPAVFLLSSRVWLALLPVHGEWAAHLEESGAAVRRPLHGERPRHIAGQTRRGPSEVLLMFSLVILICVLFIGAVKLFHPFHVVRLMCTIQIKIRFNKAYVHVCYIQYTPVSIYLPFVRIFFSNQCWPQISSLKTGVRGCFNNHP